MLSAISRLLFPPACVACGIDIDEVAFCTACIPTPLGRACPGCAMPRPREGRCDACRARPPVYDSARSAVHYAGTARDALLAFKVGRERRAARALAALMPEPAAGSVLTFVPATRRTIAERGFNPAEQIAREVAARSGLPLRALLRKRMDTPDQAGLTRHQRAANLAAAMAPAGPAPRHVTLIDDILTTGATATACAVCLRRAGSERVDVLTFARTL